MFELKLHIYLVSFLRCKVGRATPATLLAAAATLAHAMSETVAQLPGASGLNKYNGAWLTVLTSTAALFRI